MSVNRLIIVKIKPLLRPLYIYMHGMGPLVHVHVLALICWIKFDNER